MKPLSVTEAAKLAGVTSQAVSIALTDKRLTETEVIGRRAVKQDDKLQAFIDSTRNRPKLNGKGSKKR
jgi:hypothetical protein